MDEDQSTKKFVEGQRKIKVKTWTKINHQKSFLEGQPKTIGKRPKSGKVLCFSREKIRGRKAKS